jgi:hypothetical protein
VLPGINSHIALVRPDRALAGDQNILAEMRFAGHIVVMAINGLQFGAEWRHFGGGPHRGDNPFHHQLAVPTGIILSPLHAPSPDANSTFATRHNPALGTGPHKRFISERVRQPGRMKMGARWLQGRHLTRLGMMEVDPQRTCTTTSGARMPPVNNASLSTRR